MINVSEMIDRLGVLLATKAKARAFEDDALNRQQQAERDAMDQRHAEERAALAAPRQHEDELDRALIEALNQMPEPVLAADPSPAAA